jgi:TfoX N-terminal domain
MAAVARAGAGRRGAQRGLTDPGENRRAGPLGTRPLAVTDSFVAFVLEQLDPLGPIASKHMFGGVGLYAGDLFFALIAGDRDYWLPDCRPPLHYFT